MLALFGLTTISIQIATAQTPDSQDALIQKIAEKFSLKKEDVESVFNEHKAEKQAMMLANLEQKLDQGVKDNKINQAQKTAIIKKFADLKKEKQAMVDKSGTSPEDKNKAFEQKRADLQKWANDNGLDLKILYEYLGMGKRHSQKGFGRHGLK